MAISRANWHPHIHMIVTDGGFRADGTFVSWPAHEAAPLAEAFRRAVLRLFVRRGVFEDEDARAMLAWPHSGFHVHDGVWVSAEDRPFALRLARYCARNPVALDRLPYEAGTRQVNTGDVSFGEGGGLHGGHGDVRPVGVSRARGDAHSRQGPGDAALLQRYSGWYANRTRGRRRAQSTQGTPSADPVPVATPVVVADPVPLPLREARRRWAELLRQLYEVDPLACPACGGAMRVLAHPGGHHRARGDQPHAGAPGALAGDDGRPVSVSVAWAAATRG